MACSIYGHIHFKKKLWKGFEVVTDWFFENYMSLNPTKCCYMCLLIARKMIHLALNIYIYIYLKNSKEKVVIDNKLSFDNYVKKICGKAGENIKLFKLKTKRNYF